MAVNTVPDIGATPPPRPRNGLKSAGKGLWRAVVDEYDLDGQGLELLAQACRTVDVIAALDAVVAREGTMSTSSQGPRVHPALVESRQQRMALRQLVGSLGLDLEDEDVDPAVSAMARSDQARAAARARHGSGGFGGAASRRAVS